MSFWELIISIGIVCLKFWIYYSKNLKTLYLIKKYSFVVEKFLLLLKFGYFPYKNFFYNRKKKKFLIIN
jgi:hypothetical protein